MTSPGASAKRTDGGRPCLLDVDGVTLQFGGLVVLNHVTFDVRDGEIFSLIGPNGAGKSSLFNCISRLYRPSSGSIQLAGADLLALAPHQIAEQGVARTFQNCALFPTMTVHDNVVLGGYRHEAKGLTAGLVAAARGRAVRRDVEARARELLTDLGLGPVAGSLAATLDYPSQKRVELARALMSSPRLILLDEPAGGLTAAEVDEIADVVAGIRDRHQLAVLLVEHRMSMVMRLSDRVCVLDSGKVIALGRPSDVARDPAVIAAYLGDDFLATEAQA